MTRKLCSDVSDKVYKNFKCIAATKFRFKRGYTKCAVEEALTEWIEKNVNNKNYYFLFYCS